MWLSCDYHVTVMWLSCGCHMILTVTLSGCPGDEGLEVELWQFNQGQCSKIRPLVLFLMWQEISPLPPSLPPHPFLSPSIEALQEYILYCCQHPHGGLIDKPGKSVAYSYLNLPVVHLSFVVDLLFVCSFVVCLFVEGVVTSITPATVWVVCLWPSIAMVTGESSISLTTLTISW